MATTYLSMTLPTVSTTLGPQWATDLNACLEIIDSHDHSDGNGAKVTPAGMTINEDLDVGGNHLDDVKSTRYVSQNAALAGSDDVNSSYVVNGNLYYNNSAGVAVQVTSGSSVNAPGSGTWDVTNPGAYPYTVVTGDAQRVILVDTTSARTVTLPAATNVICFIIKDKSNASQTNNITVTPDGTDTIDGVNASIALNVDGIAQGFISDGVSAWYRI
jgi:hypothetical protein